MIGLPCPFIIFSPAGEQAAEDSDGASDRKETDRKQQERFAYDRRANIADPHKNLCRNGAEVCQ